MHSENSSTVQVHPRRSFIEEARRAQIMSAAVDTLAELGYGKTSLAQIARRAGISTSLILYHFKDKDELMRQTITDISTAWHSYVQKEVAEAATATDRLRVYVESNLAYMGTRPKHFEALVEIMFNARDDEGVLLYRVPEQDDPTMSHLERVLAEGQKSGEFRPFDVRNMAIAIRGTIDQFLGQQYRRPDFDLEAYIAEVVEVCDRATRRDEGKEG